MRESELLEVGTLALGHPVVDMFSHIMPNCSFLQATLGMLAWSIDNSGLMSCSHASSPLGALRIQQKAIRILGRERPPPPVPEKQLIYYELDLHSAAGNRRRGICIQHSREMSKRHVCLILVCYQ